MSKARILGITILIIGIIVKFTLENDMTDFVSGLLIGVGTGVIITGKISSK